MNIEQKSKTKKIILKIVLTFTFAIKDRTTVISIAPNETEKLSDIVYGIERELQDGHHLQSEEKFEIDEDIKFIMEYEEKENRRMDNELYPYFKFIAQNKNNPEKLNQLLRHVNGGAEQCI